MDREQFEAAALLLSDQERICRKLDVPEGLALCLLNQALMQSQLGRVEVAKTLADEAERLAREHGLTTILGQVRPILEMLHKQQ